MGEYELKAKFTTEPNGLFIREKEAFHTTTGGRLAQQDTSGTLMISLYVYCV
jgi:hypothetical protein